MIQRQNGVIRWAAATLTAGAILLTGCGVIEDTVDGFTESPSSPGTPDPGASGEIAIEVRFDSDGGTARSVEIEIDSPSSPQSLREDAVDLPFGEEFTIEADAFLPFRGVTAQAEAGEGATFISCEIVIDGEVVASDHSSGSGARAECERQLRLGPS